MTADLLRHRTRADLVDQAPAVKSRRTRLVAARIVLEPAARSVAVRRGRDLRMLAAASCFAAIEEEMADDAPRGGDLVLDEELEQAIDHLFALELAGAAITFGSEQVERPPDELEVEAQREDAAFERDRPPHFDRLRARMTDRKSTRLNSSH